MDKVLELQLNVACALKIGARVKTECSCKKKWTRNKYKEGQLRKEKSWCSCISTMEQSDPENRNIQPTDYPDFSLCSGMSLTITAPSDLMLESGSEVGDGLTLKLCTISEFLDDRSRGCSEFLCGKCGVSGEVKFVTSHSENWVTLRTNLWNFGVRLGPLKWCTSFSHFCLNLEKNNHAKLWTEHLCQSPTHP